MKLRASGRLDLVIGAVALIQALVIAVMIGVVSIEGPHVMRPVVARLSGADFDDADGSGALTVATIDVTLAGVALLALVALARLVSAIGPVARFRAEAGARGTHGYRWSEAAFVWPILVFLIAQLNSITDIGALVAMYALASAVALFAFLQDRAAVGARWAFSFGTMIGIVPWGIVAFHQIGAGLVGEEPSLGLRVITLAMLAAVLTTWVVQWLELRQVAKASAGVARRGLDPVFSLTSFAAVTVFAWLALLVPL